MSIAYSDLCPAGQVPFLAPSNGEPKSCKTNLVGVAVTETSRYFKNFLPKAKEKLEE